MNWLIKHGNIIDEPADVLICSANVMLNLSGGVGADLLGRYGLTMQKKLHEIVNARNPHAVERGEVISYEGEEVPYKAVLHAVAVNGWYESSPDVVEQIVRKSLSIAASDYRAKRVALTVLATGFGDLTLDDFAVGVRPLLKVEFPPVEEVVISLLEDFRLAEFAKALPEVSDVA